jgi:hypothetical protein
MLLSVQRFEVAELGVERVFSGVFHPAIWIHVVALRGATVDERLTRALGAARPTSGRRLVALCLDGDSRVWRPIERTFDAGCALACNGRSTLAGATNALERPSLTLNVDWDARAFGSSLEGAIESGRLSAHDRVRKLTIDLASRIATAWKSAVAAPLVGQAVEALLDALRSEGFDVPRVRASDLGGYETLQDAGRAVDVALSTPGSLPAVCDVERELGASLRTVQRRLPEVLSAWGYASAGFRDVRRQLSLFRACAVMSHPRATTELGARAIGFASPNAFCRAFQQRGLPSPSRVRELLHELG